MSDSEALSDNLTVFKHLSWKPIFERSVFMDLQRPKKNLYVFDCTSGSASVRKNSKQPSTVFIMAMGGYWSLCFSGYSSLCANYPYVVASL